MAFKMGQYPEDSSYKTDLHSKKKGEEEKKKINKKISQQQRMMVFLNYIKVANSFA